MSRLTRHLLSQQSLYPLYPPPEGMFVDLEKLDTFARLSCTPHILVIPSDLRYFIKVNTFIHNFFRNFVLYFIHKRFFALNQFF